jgi:hypothetical protein
MFLEKKIVGEIKRLLYAVTIFRKLGCLWDNVEKLSTSGEATDDNMAHAYFTRGTKQTLRICNTYCFFTATVVAWTRLSVTLYVQCLVKHKRCLYLTHLIHWTASFCMHNERYGQQNKTKINIFSVSFLTHLRTYPYISGESWYAGWMAKLDSGKR